MQAVHALASRIAQALPEDVDPMAYAWGAAGADPTHRKARGQVYGVAAAQWDKAAEEEMLLAQMMTWHELFCLAPLRL